MSKKISTLKNKKDIDSLVLLLNDSNSNIRHEAIDAIEALKAKEASKEIFKCLNDKDIVVRMNAIRTLGSFKDLNAVDELINLLKDRNEDIRIYAARALGKIGDSKAITPLYKLLNDPKEYLRIVASEVIFSMKKEEISEFENSGDIDSLILLLADANSAVRVKAIETLEKLHASNASDNIIKCLHDKDKTVRLKAIRALGNLKVTYAVYELIELLKDYDDSIRLNAIKSLGQIGDSNALNPLTELLKDKNELVQNETKKTISILASEDKNLTDNEINQIIEKSKAKNELFEILGISIFFLIISWVGCIAIGFLLLHGQVDQNIMRGGAYTDLEKIFWESTGIDILLSKIQIFVRNLLNISLEKGVSAKSILLYSIPISLIISIGNFFNKK